MHRRRVGTGLAILLCALAAAGLGRVVPLDAREDEATVHLVADEGEAARYWARWRGPTGQGLVTGDYPDTWSPSTTPRWRTAVPGRGNSSPIVWGDRIFLTTAQDEGRRLSVLAFRRSDGTRLWELVVPQDGVEKVHAKNGHASATPTTDGEIVYASFGSQGLVAVDFDGRLVWHRKIGDLQNYHGSAGSPVLYKDRVFLYQDHKGGAGVTAFVAAFDKKTGQTKWWRERTETVGWGTPVVVRAGDRDELVVSSQHRVAAYDPDTGDELWTVKGNTFEVIPTPVVGHGLIFCSSGRAGPTMAIRPGGRGDVTDTHVVWKAPKGSPFVPSPLLQGDYLYLVNDMSSILTAYRARTGEVVYQGRLGEVMREGFSASPVAVGDRLFFTNDLGETFVVKAGPTFDLLHVNRLDARTLATPALVDGVWYFRTENELIAIGH
ncbi:MAG: PQQ-binding-like beta-propeller repeat protein [Acidobacteria bacterium]|nr:PQQ-binding-like beta-propeller repeat protein [Acidobacteriota bacterium]